MTTENQSSDALVDSQLEVIRSYSLPPQTTSQAKKVENLKTNNQSRYVTVKRFIESFALKDNTTILADATMSIGSFIDSQTNNDVRPLSRDEEELIMPEIVNLKPTDPLFSREVKAHFIDMTIYVPAEGIRLNITTRPVEFTNSIGDKVILNQPEVPLDYTMWRLIEKHVAKDFKIASSLEEADKYKHKYYIEDLTTQNDKKNKAFEFKQQAMVEFVKLTNGKSMEDNKDKIAMVFDLTSDIHQDTSIGKTTQDLVRILDEKVLSKNPAKFTEILKDEDLSDKALLKRCLTYNVISKQGNTYFLDNDPMGDLNEAIKYLNNPEKSGIRLKLEALLEEKLKFIKK